jgi:hypothetical protein
LLAKPLDQENPIAAAAALRGACVMAAADFAGAVVALRARPITENEAQAFVGEQCAIPDPGAIACAIYLLAQSHGVDLAATAGWRALELGRDEDVVIIALADVLRAQEKPKQSAARLMRERCSEQRSQAFLVKLADHYRTGGQAFLTEACLRDFIRRGRKDLRIRLAEHWVEMQDWRSARALLAEPTPDEPTANTLYLSGRSAIGLLQENEVMQAVAQLGGLPQPGPRYADLLRSVWQWRIGDTAEATKLCPEGAFPPLMERDAATLRRARSEHCPAAVDSSLSGGWRGIRAQAKLPNALCIGMQRTATTWLWRQLRHHPDIHTTPYKEPVFFSDPFPSLDGHISDLRDHDLGEAGRRYWQGPTRNIGRYAALFASDKPVRLDVSPSYGELPEESVAMVAELLGGGTRIILCVRDPVERSWSNLKYELQATGAHPMSLSFAERAALYGNVATLRRCDYALVLRTWRRFFHNIEIVFLDDVAARPEAVMARLRRFLALSPSSGEDESHPVNSSASIEMPAADRAFLFGLHQQNYAASEAELGGPALHWRERQLRLIG